MVISDEDVKWVIIGMVMGDGWNGEVGKGDGDMVADVTILIMMVGMVIAEFQRIVVIIVAMARVVIAGVVVAVVLMTGAVMAGVVMGGVLVAVVITGMVMVGLVDDYSGDG